VARARVAGPPARKYRAAPGASFSQKEAPAVGLRLEQLERQGPVTPEAVVEDARDCASPLNKFFTWDDSEAARLRRLDEARRLVNHLVTVVVHGGHDTEVRGFHSVVIVQAETREPERAYVSLATVENSPALRHQVVEAAWRELRAWRRRYGTYRDLLPVIEAIEAAEAGA
jgi:hypothetical protein